jgi:hypothetical protein
LPSIRGRRIVCPRPKAASAAEPIYAFVDGI